MKNPYNHRRRLVDYAQARGTKAAAREFRTTLFTVRKWLRRYAAQGLKEAVSKLGVWKAEC